MSMKLDSVEEPSMFWAFGGLQPAKQAEDRQLTRTYFVTGVAFPIFRGLDEGI